MTYHDTFDRLGIPVARPVRFAALRRIAQSARADGIFIVAALIIIAAMVALFVFK
jgi:hypothetical protein